MAHINITPELKAKVEDHKKKAKNIEGRELSDEQALSEVMKGRKVSEMFNQKIDNEL